MPRGGPDGGDGGRGGDVVLVADPGLRDLSHFRHQRHFKAQRGGHGEGSQRHGAAGERPRAERPAAAPSSRTSRAASATTSRAPGRRAVVARGGARRLRQQALRDLDPPGAAVRRARPAGRGGDARAAPEAARRRRPRRAAERRQVVAAAAPHAGPAQGRRLSVHDARAGARHDRRRRGPPARAGRHPRPDRGRRARAPGSVTSSSPTSSARSLLVHVVDVAPLDGSDPWDAFTTVRGELAALRRRARGAAVLRRAEQDRPAAAGGQVDAADRRRGASGCAEIRASAGRRRAGRDRRRRPSPAPACRPCAARSSRWCRRRPSPRRAEEAAVAEHAVYRPGERRVRASSARPTARSASRGRRSSGSWSATTSRTRTRSRTSRSG